MYHTAVMQKEVMEFLKIEPDGIYVDATYGGGGHSALILKKLNKGKLFAFDSDTDAMNNVIKDSRLIFINQNFRFLENYLNYYQCTAIDGLFADLGVSSYQIENPAKGFSYLYPDEKLDMRFNKNIAITAADILNTYSVDTLTSLFYRYSQLPFSKKLATSIVNRRAIRQFSIVSDLHEVISRFTDARKKYKTYSRVFQALRMEVNDETGALNDLLNQALSVLKPGGRLIVISYHSGEDRLVKNFLKTGRTDGHIEKDIYGNTKKVFELLTPKPVIPTNEEIKNNPRARSAKLRAGIKNITLTLTSQNEEKSKT